MGRTALTPKINTANDIPEDVAEKKDQAAQELAAIENRAADNVKALASDLQYDGPLDADSLQREVIGTGAALARATFYHGAALLLLREATLHGDWEQRLEQLPFSRRTAYNYMTIAAKFKDKKTRDALANMGTLKLLEFAALDDGEIDAFAKGESVRGITVSEAEKMTHKELLAKLADSQAEADTAMKLAGERNAEITKLQLQLKKKVVADTDWPDALDPLSEQIAAAGRKIAQGLSELETCRIKAFDVGSEIPEGDSAQRAKFEAALAHVAGVYADALKGADKVLGAELAAFDSTLGGFLAE